MDVTLLVISTNDVILNYSFRVMEVWTSYVKSLHKTETMKIAVLCYNTVDFDKRLFHL